MIIGDTKCPRKKNMIKMIKKTVNNIKITTGRSPGFKQTKRAS